MVTCTGSAAISTGNGIAASWARRTSAVDHGRELETQALAKRGGCLDKDIVAIEGGEDDLALEWPGAESDEHNNSRAASLFAEHYLKASFLNCRRKVKSMSWNESLLASDMAACPPSLAPESQDFQEMSTQN